MINLLLIFFYKVVSIIVIMAIALTMTAFAEGEATISVGNVAGTLGEIVEVQIEIKNNPGIASVGFDVTYDNKALKLIEVVDGGICGENLHSPDLTTCPYFLYWFNPTVTENFVDNGILTTLKFEILPEAKTATYAVNISYSVENHDILNVNLGDVEFKVNNGKIVVNDEKSEANEDDVVNATDSKEKELTSEKRAEDVICLKIDNPSAFANGKYGLIDSANDKVVPYIKNDRTLVPLRFVSETLGAQVEWENGWNYCYNRSYSRR